MFSWRLARQQHLRALGQRRAGGRVGGDVVATGEADGLARAARDVAVLDHSLELAAATRLLDERDVLGEAPVEDEDAPVRGERRGREAGGGGGAGRGEVHEGELQIQVRVSDQGFWP